VQLSTSSSCITDLFNRSAPHGRMSFEEWLGFVRNEQLGSGLNLDVGDGEHEHHHVESMTTQDELDTAHRQFDRSGSAKLRVDRDLNLTQFAQLLLSPENDAVASGGTRSSGDLSVCQPLTHYWTACSHNSYIVGDQLTGLSSDDMYRRQLLQGFRNVEIDCWDGSISGRPVVTHGRTFCTLKPFSAVAKALAECAFVTSELPVVLNLEMHCSPKQQRDLAASMIEHLEKLLITHVEITEAAGKKSLSPFDLKRRILAKGKVKVAKDRSSLGTGSRTILRMPSSLLRQSSSLRRTSDRQRPSTRASIRTKVLFRASSFEDEIQEPFQTVEAEIAAHASRAQQTLEQQYLSTKLKSTDEYYAATLSLRSLHLQAFLGDEQPTSPPTMTSINEDRLLIVLGLTAQERNQIEGLASVHERFGLTEEQMSAHAVTLAVVDPPPTVGIMQRKTSARLLRSYPLGLRFSGKNMSPVPSWLCGCQYVAINVSYVDLALQLHFALFDGRGYVLKPVGMRSAQQEAPSAKVRAQSMLPPKQPSPEMRVEEAKPPLLRSQSLKEPSSSAASNDTAGASDNTACWPPPREKLHRTTIEIISLHHLPKRREGRPHYNGSRARCHAYHPELSGRSAPPDDRTPSSPALSLLLAPIGGFCAISSTLPLPDRATELHRELSTPAVPTNGMNAAFNTQAHCVAAEPHTTFLRISVTDGGVTVAYESVILGRLRRGYRVLRMRSPVGTRIELCYLLVKVGFGSEPHLWPTIGQLRLRSSTGEANQREIIKLSDENRTLADKVVELERRLEQQAGTSAYIAHASNFSDVQRSRAPTVTLAEGADWRLQSAITL